MSARKSQSQAEPLSRTASGSAGIQSIEVGLPLLAELAESHKPVSLSELARRVGMPASKAHKYMTSFIRAGMVEQHPVSGYYDLGPLALWLGLAALRRTDVVETALATMNQLRDVLNQTISLTVWMQSGPTIVRLAESSRAVSVTVRVGSVLPVLGSSSGPLFAAFMPPRQTQPRIAQELVERSAVLAGLGISGEQDVLPFLDKVRARGLMRSEGTVLPGVSGLSAPVFNHEGIVATLTIVAVQADIDLSWDGEAAQLLRSSAAALSARLGGRASIASE